MLRMEAPFPRFQLWFWGKKKEEVAVSDEGSMNSSSDWGYGMREPATVKFPTVTAPKASASPRKIKKKWQSREDKRVDREYDIVLVPSDGGCLSGSESDDSDWSIGWLEPHGSDFLSDDETDDSFAVLVPCYRNDSKGLIVEGPSNQLLGALKNLTDEHFTDGKYFMEQWLTSLHNY